MLYNLQLMYYVNNLYIIYFIMFPFIELSWTKIYFQWLWIVLATLVFFYGLYRYSYKSWLKFPNLFSFLPFFIIVPYLLWRYFYNAIEYHNFLPLDIMSLISPYDYQFSFIGVSFWILLVIFLFLLSLDYKQERKKYIDVFFYSITLALVVIWPFLFLWNWFYGNVTNSIFWISPFVENSNITQKVRPVWIFVSILWLFLYLLWKFVHFIFKSHWLSIYLLPFLFLGFAYIFTFQHYPKHYILYTIDIKIFYCFFMLIIAPIFLYLLTLKNKKW